MFCCFLWGGAFGFGFRFSFLIMFFWVGVIVHVISSFSFAVKSGLVFFVSLRSFCCIRWWGFVSILLAFCVWLFLAFGFGFILFCGLFCSFCGSVGLFCTVSFPCYVCLVVVVTGLDRLRSCLFGFWFCLVRTIVRMLLVLANRMRLPYMVPFLGIGSVWLLRFFQLVLFSLVN